MEKCFECKTNEIPDPEYCCNGYMCGCMGKPIDPPFCDECFEKLLSKSRVCIVDAIEPTESA